MLAGLGVPTFISCALIAVVKSGTFEPVQFGTGFAGIMVGLTSLAVGVSVKSKTDTP